MSTFVNERVIGTPATAWHCEASVRGGSSAHGTRGAAGAEEGDGLAVPPSLGLAPALRAILWWGTDDHAWSPKVPLHGAANAVPPSMDDHDCMARSDCRASHGL